ncbi:RNA-binding protein [Insolitispirillum peregrinum]|uniref:Predicted RNA-binding protein YlxR, DUF448 family n=1 Tax=Insolitispirillum peregrinum TaxID=80876 RepID=A0A1N7JN48_9PROT|nr:RNA-binding protein [Insolitispirillum peregrinum]SIS50664.1 Predicted RNA-binding protein YlxR, DUF448 family [Insolitispirillum peregrinum]
MTSQSRVPIPPDLATAPPPPDTRRKGHRKGEKTAPRHGAADSDSDPTLRRCIVSGESFPKERMIRFVATPDGSVVADLDGKLPGRGLWLSARRDMVETATRKRAFSRAARQALTAPPDLADQVAMQLRNRCLDTLGFARRAGLVVAGFDKVKAEAKAGRVVLLLEAEDGAEDGRRKLTALAPKAPVVDMFSGAELAAILGRDHVVHVALVAGPLAQRPLVARLEHLIDRLVAYLGQGDCAEHVPAPAQGRTEPTEPAPAHAWSEGPSEHTDFDA